MATNSIRCSTLLHGSEVVVFDGLVVSMGIDHGGVELLVPQELLDGSDRATGIEQLCGGGVSEAVRVNLDPTCFPASVMRGMDQVFAQRLVAVEEDVVA